MSITGFTTFPPNFANKHHGNANETPMTLRIILMVPFGEMGVIFLTTIGNNDIFIDEVPKCW